MPLVGDTTLMDAQTIKLAGADANGVVGHAMLTPNAPIPEAQDFVKRFEERYHVVPDHNAIQGYMAVWMVKAATEKMGKPDADHLAADAARNDHRPGDRAASDEDDGAAERRHGPPELHGRGPGRPCHCDQSAADAAADPLLWTISTC